MGDGPTQVLGYKMPPLVASCMSGGQVVALLFILPIPFWLPFVGYPLQWSCRISRVNVPAYNRALQVSFAELAVVFAIIIGASLAYSHLGVDTGTTTRLASLITAVVTIIVPVAVYGPMMRVTYRKALLIAVLRYPMTLLLSAVGLYWVVLISVIDRLTR